MKYVICTKPTSPFLTEGKTYVALISMYPAITDYFIADDSMKQHWHPKYSFRDATEEEIKIFSEK
jgi:hypothetical protein